mmetsp:Transcript_40938/g.100696  ORF Transcript_40938/g.100696 Transcript_40938/m.100696 type:complete len:92 (-) Transcript_40938:221-496(-)
MTSRGGGGGGSGGGGYAHYVQNGRIVERPWYAYSITDVFFGALNVIVAFFHTMVSQPATEQFTRGKRADGGGRRGGASGGYDPGSHVSAGG